MKRRLLSCVGMITLLFALVGCSAAGQAVKEAQQVVEENQSSDAGTDAEGQESSGQADSGLLMESELKNVGEMNIEEGSILCDQCGTVICTYSIEGLSMDGVKAGDASIEEQLNDIREAKIQNLHSYYDEQECEYHSDEYYTPNSETEYTTVPYVSEDYIGVLMDGYDYWSGAAHGISYRDFYLFDRNTGEQLGIQDILATPQEEFHEILVEQFEESWGQEEDLDMDYIQQHAGYYSEDGTFDGGCYYLNEDGLVFYYTVYEVASYAMGMPSVQIPYDELSWKLPLYG